MDPAHDDGRASRLRLGENSITGEAIAGADADSDDVAGIENTGIEWLDRLIHEDRLPGELARCGLRQHKEPARRDYAVAHRVDGGIDEERLWRHGRVAVTSGSACGKFIMRASACHRELLRRGSRNPDEARSAAIGWRRATSFSYHSAQASTSEQ